VILPPGDAWVSCRTICAVTQSTPVRRDRVGDGLGEGERLLVRLGDGLGLFDGLGLVEGPALVELLGLSVGVDAGAGLGLSDGLGLCEALEVGVAAGVVPTTATSSLAETTAADGPHGECCT
jgi:hypothetical protein